MAPGPEQSGSQAGDDILLESLMTKPHFCIYSQWGSLVFVNLEKSVKIEISIHSTRACTRSVNIVIFNINLNRNHITLNLASWRGLF